MDKYSKDELEAPEWLNRSFIEKVLRKSEGDDNLTITSFNVGPATEKGKHFASIMFRISVDYLTTNKPKQISLILKTIPVVDGPKKELITGTQAFETEIKMYSEVIPKFHKILKEIGDNTVLGARMIYSSLEPIKIIIFEDLTKQGYQMIPNKFLEPDEIDTLLKKICWWHAISFKLIKEDDEYIKGFQDGAFDIGEHIDVWLNDTISGFSKFLNDENIDEIYSKKFDKLKGTLIKKCKDIYQLKGNLCVLNHGDFHLNNMMVKFGQNNKIDDLMLVDFQFCIAAPFTVDLTYLLSAVLNPNCRDRRDEILYKYHKQFAENLNKLDYKGDIPTLIDIQKQLMLHKELELMMLIGFLPFMCALKEEVEMDESLTEDPKVFLSFFELPTFKQTAKKILPELLYKGFFE